MNEKAQEFIHRIKRRMAVVMLGYERWKREADDRKAWNELTIAEAEIALGMWQIGMEDAATLIERYDPSLSAKIREAGRG